MAEATIPILEMKNVGQDLLAERTVDRGPARRQSEREKGRIHLPDRASGCGKSTLCAWPPGLRPQTHGDNLMWGVPITGPGPSRGNGLSGLRTVPWLNVRDNIGFGPKSRGRTKAENRETVDHFIDLVGLPALCRCLPAPAFRRHEAARRHRRVLANDAEVVLMDEPFGALDAMTRERPAGRVVEIWSRTGLTVLFVTHAIEEAIFLADRVVVMSPGPGRIDNEYRIDLQRPRDIASPEFNEWRRMLSSQLHSHHGRKAG